eukprot:4843592-Pleurochrysis_carterae.AAC.2
MSQLAFGHVWAVDPHALLERADVILRKVTARAHKQVLRRGGDMGRIGIVDIRVRIATLHIEIDEWLLRLLHGSRGGLV